MVNRHFQIVIADDDKDDQLFFEEAVKLSDLSCEITSFYDGSTVLEYLHNKVDPKKQKLPDLIILDINMPHINGIEVLSTIKSDTSLKGIPVYMLSTTKEESTQRQCKGLGAIDFFTKPDDMSGLIGIVENIFASVPA